MKGRRRRRGIRIIIIIRRRRRRLKGVTNEGIGEGVHCGHEHGEQEKYSDFGLQF